MGINELLKIFRPMIRKIDLSLLKGKKAAVDMKGLLYKGVYASLNNIENVKTDLYLHYPLKILSLLRSYNIKVIAVFDGKIPPIKLKEIQKRKDRQEKNMALANALSLEGRKEDSRRVFKRTLKVKSRMINSLIDVLKLMEIDVIVAPYEADAQISFLYKTKQADFAISEDSDLIAYGVKKIGFKLTKDGTLDYLDLTERNISESPDVLCRFLTKIPHYKLVQFCVFLGCDYLSSLKYLGIKTCCRLIGSYNDIDTIVDKMKSSGKFAFENNDEKEYLKEDKKAFCTFYMQTIYDNINNTLSPIWSLKYDEENDTVEDLIEKSNVYDIYESIEDKSLFGEFFNNYEDFCNGNLDVKTMLKDKKEEPRESIEWYYKKYRQCLRLENILVKGSNESYQEDIYLEDYRYFRSLIQDSETDNSFLSKKRSIVTDGISLECIFPTDDGIKDKELSSIAETKYEKTGDFRKEYSSNCNTTDVNY